MGFIIKYDDMTHFNRSCNNQLANWKGNVEDLETKLTTFTNMESFSGGSSENIKAYIAETNSTVLTSLQEIFLEFQSRYILYKNGFYTDVDENDHTAISEEVLTDLKNKLNNSYADYLEIRDNELTEVSKIQDLISGFPNSTLTENGYNTTVYKIQSTLDTIGNYEYRHLRDDFSQLDNMLSSLTAFCNQMLAEDSDNIGIYQPGSILNSPSYIALSSIIDDASAKRLKIESEIVVATEAESVRDSALLKEERITQGWVSFLQGSLIVAGGVLLIAGSWGTLAPGVVPAVMGTVGMAAGGSTVIAGGSSMYESGHNFLLGQAGDVTTVAVNPLRDWAFHGNQDAFNGYYTGALASSAIMGFGIGAYGTYTSAVSGGYNGFQAVGVYSGKVVVSAASGAASGYGGYRTALALGVKEPYAQLIGTGTGLLGASLAGWGVNKADKAYNWSGTNPTATPNGNGYSTAIDSKVTEINKAYLPDSVKYSFTDGEYRTVVTNEDISVYRAFGGNADMGGGYATTSPAVSRIDAKLDTALLPSWGNTRMYEAEIVIPKGTVINIGKVAPQTIPSTGTVLPGGADQVLLPQDWSLDWVNPAIKYVPN